MTRTFDHLPDLTPDQANVVGAMLSPHATIHEVAEFLDITFATLFDLLASPAVKAHLTHIRRTLDTRVKIRLADAAHKAVDTLEHITASPAPQGNPAIAPVGGETTWQTERRRAATTLLRAHTAPQTRLTTRRSLDDRRNTRHIEQTANEPEQVIAEPSSVAPQRRERGRAPDRAMNRARTPEPNPRPP